MFSSFPPLPTLSTLTSALFNPPKIQTRFESAAELATVSECLQRLIDKRVEINTVVNGDAGNPAYQKWMYLNELLVALEAVIKDFNASAKSFPDAAEKQEMIVLAESLKEKIDAVLKDPEKKAALNVARPEQNLMKKSAVVAVNMTSQAVKYGTETASYYLSMAQNKAFGTPMPESKPEVVNEDKATVQILNQFSEKLAETIKNLKAILANTSTEQTPGEEEKAHTPTSPRR